MDNWPHADTLKRIRSERGLSMESAAHEIGATRAAWDRWERRHISPSAEMLKAMIEAFAVPPSALGYEPPKGWEFVPKEWIAERFDRIDYKLDRLLSRK